VVNARDRTRLLNAMMCAVLGRASLGDDESFFAGGGTSLLAARLVASISAGLGVALDVRDVYEHPTPLSLSERITRAQPSLPPPQRTERPRVVPLAPVQRRLWFHNRLFPGDASYNMATAVRIHGPVDAAALRMAVLDVVERHEVLRTVYPEWGGVPQQEVLAPVEAEIDLRLEETAGDGLDLVRADAAIGFDITVEPPLRALLVREREDCHLLGLVIHHIACDGWSLAPLLDDLAGAYCYRTGRGPRPVPLALQYADYALWAQAALTTEGGGSDELAFWRNELRDAPAVRALDGMRPRRGSPDNSGGECRRRTGPRLHEALARRARELDASPFMLVHAALVVAIQRMGGQEDCVVGTPVAGRPDPSLEGLVGFFVNTLALRVDASGNPTFEALVARVRAVDLSALAHDRTPFDRILQDLNPPREGGWVPLIGVMLAYQNTAPAEMTLPGLQCETLAVPSGSARFDLRLEVVERGAPSHPAGLELTATWAAQVASVEVAERLLDLVEQILTEATDDPTRRLRRLGRTDGEALDAPVPPTPDRFPRGRNGRSRIAFICSPFGQQWAGMGRRMLADEPVFAEAVDACAAELSQHVAWDVRRELTRDPVDSRLDDVTVGQPLVFVLQVALARWLESRGVFPSVVAGHSIGEIAASVIAGMLPLRDAVRLLVHYTRVQGRLAGRGGAMMLVEAAPGTVEQALVAVGDERVVIATVNGPRTTALAGPRVALERVKTALESRRLPCAWIRVDVAAHGPDIDAVLPDLVASVSGIEPRPPRVPLISSVTGAELDWRDADPHYFARNLRHRVQFSTAVSRILDEPTGALVEVSANPILGPALQECVDDLGAPTHVLATMRRMDPDDRVGPRGLVDFLGPAFEARRA
jgi:malonyl CoA-acyl carrier protein transacylase